MLDALDKDDRKDTHVGRELLAKELKSRPYHEPQTWGLQRIPTENDVVELNPIGRGGSSAIWVMGSCKMAFVPATAMPSITQVRQTERRIISKESGGDRHIKRVTKEDPL